MSYIKIQRVLERFCLYISGFGRHCIIVFRIFDVKTVIIIHIQRNFGRIRQNLMRIFIAQIQRCTLVIRFNKFSVKSRRTVLFVNLFSRRNIKFRQLRQNNLFFEIFFLPRNFLNNHKS